MKTLQLYYSGNPGTAVAFVQMPGKGTIREVTITGFNDAASNVAIEVSLASIPQTNVNGALGIIAQLHVCNSAAGIATFPPSVTHPNTEVAAGQMIYLHTSGAAANANITVQLVIS